MSLNKYFYYIFLLLILPKILFLNLELKIFTLFKNTIRWFLLIVQRITISIKISFHRIFKVQTLDSTLSYNSSLGTVSVFIKNLRSELVALRVSYRHTKRNFNLFEHYFAPITHLSNDVSDVYWLKIQLKFWERNRIWNIQRILYVDGHITLLF